MNKQQVNKETIIKHNRKIIEELVNIENAIVTNDIKYMNEFIFFVMRLKNLKIKMLPQTKEASSSILSHIVGNYIENISHNLGALCIWYTLSYLADDDEQKNKETEQLFYEIFLQMDDDKTFFYFLQSFIEIFKSKSHKEMIQGILAQKNDEAVDSKFIFKLIYFIIFIKGISEELEPLYKLLDQYLDNAIQDKDDDLVFYLYQPLLFVHNTIKVSKNDFAHFNNQIEKKLEKYIYDEVIPKYKIKQNNKKQNNKKIAFLIDRLTGISIHKVFYRFLKVLTENNNELDIYVYNINWMEGSGSNLSDVNEIKKLNLKYIDCHEKFVGDKNPIYSIVEKSIKIRKDIISQKIDTLVMLNGRPEFNFLFTTRTAANQIYWSHGNSAYDLDGIDKRISHFEHFSNEYEFKTFNIPIDLEYYNPKIDEEVIIKEREKYPKDKKILGMIGRLVKIDNDDYLSTIAKIMQKNTDTVFIVAGPGDNTSIKNKIKKYNLSDRFYFPGFVDTHIYGNIIDLYLDPFPLGGGEALGEFIYKGKPFVAFVPENRRHLYIYSDLYILLSDSVDEFKKSSLIQYDLYSQEDMDTIRKYKYLHPINKNTMIYQDISAAFSKEEYIDIALEFLENEKLCNKVSSELLFTARLQSKDIVKSFLKIIR